MCQRLATTARTGTGVRRLENGDENAEHYAIGWHSDSSDRLFGEGHRVHAVHHGGVSKGAMSWLVIYPDFQLVVAIKINTRAKTFQAFSRVETAISRTFLGKMEKLGFMP